MLQMELVGRFVKHYNDERLHGAIGYIIPKDKLEGREKNIFAERWQVGRSASENKSGKQAS